MDGMNGMPTQIIQIDPVSNDAFLFRKEIICNEHNESDNFLYNMVPYSADMNEEVWKFSKKKWESVGFDSLFGVYYNNELAAISGAKYYGPASEYLRVGMMYYVLKRYRYVVRSMLWAPGGLIEAALTYHKLNSLIQYSFISIYPHNSKLAALCNVMTRRDRLGQIGNGKTHINLMKSYAVYDKQIEFNGVNQHILYRPEVEFDDDNIDTMIDILNKK